MMTGLFARCGARDLIWVWRSLDLTEPSIQKQGQECRMLAQSWRMSSYLENGETMMILWPEERSGQGFRGERSCLRWWSEWNRFRSRWTSARRRGVDCCSRGGVALQCFLVFHERLLCLVDASGKCWRKRRRDFLLASERFFNHSFSSCFIWSISSLSLLSATFLKYSSSLTSA